MFISTAGEDGVIWITELPDGSNPVVGAGAAIYQTEAELVAAIPQGAELEGDVPSSLVEPPPPPFVAAPPPSNADAALGAILQRADLSSDYPTRLAAIKAAVQMLGASASPERIEAAAYYELRGDDGV